MKLEAHGMTFEVDPPQPLEPWPEGQEECVGYVTVAHEHGQWSVAWVVRPDQNEAEVQRFTDWATGVIARLIEHGPDVDGWALGARGHYLWARPLALPPDPFVDDAP